MQLREKVGNSLLSTPPHQASRLTETKEAHQQQHQKPVRQATGVAEGWQRPGGRGCNGGASAGLVGAAGQQRSHFLLLLLHRANGRPRDDSDCNSGRKPLPEPSENSAHVTAVTHVTPRQVKQGYAHVSGREHVVGRAGREKGEAATFVFFSSGLGAEPGPSTVDRAVLSFLALLSLPSPRRSFGESAGLPSGPTPGVIDLLP